MKKSITLFTFLLLLPFTISAQSATGTEKGVDDNVYQTCKKNALERKNILLGNIAHNYRKASSEITKKTYRDIERMKWMIYSSYRTESKRILQEQREVLGTLNASTTQLRKTALATWKAEDSLCDYNHNKAMGSSTPQKETKNKKGR